ncbi:DUF2735 domain-containing protein [Rhizobium grahamii]|uniref:Glutamine synthetase n=2 Tax=Rhizobium grahamii TaxID=1120045 RepID=S3HNC1_9HYPH|nr:DUF2735 domain-containing protein [Rhizobium grahamii]EPE94911.1 glutamine synthetase [Rhizobium grahamii CCGE 502]RDJ05690.1 glutamine synthetase [Rhizobium grahamii]
MTIGVHHETATIYSFPAKRFVAAEPRMSVDLESQMEASVYDSCWYHDEAMKESEKASQPKFTPRIVD